MSTSENILTDLRGKLSQSRDWCPGLSEDVYALTDYMSMVSDHDPRAVSEPHDTFMTFFLCLEDVKKGHSGFACLQEDALPEYLRTHSRQVLAEAKYVPQVIDAIADESFATEFRMYCKDLLGFDPPRKVEEAELLVKFGDYPEFITVAVNWWANAIMNPKFDNGDSMTSFVMSKLSLGPSDTITQAQLNVFKVELASQIKQEMLSSFDTNCLLSVDYNPDASLATAAMSAGIDTAMRFPWKTAMQITNQNVMVSAGYGAPWKTLWSAPSIVTTENSQSSKSEV